MDWAICGPVDWSATGSMLSGIGTLLGVVAVFYAAYKGSDTFKQWRRQKSEERRIDLAEQVLTLAYKLKRAIEGIRSPVMFGEELDKAELQLRERQVIDDDTPDAVKRYLKTAQGMLARVKFHRDEWDALLDIIPVSKAVFGDRVEKQLNVFLVQQRNIVNTAHSYSELPTDVPQNAMAEHAEEAKQLRRTMWSTGKPDEDAIMISIDASVAALEAMLLPIIRSDTPFGIAPLNTDN